MNRNSYPICPMCGGRVAGAMMTSGAIKNIFLINDKSPYYNDLYYHPTAISLYCVSGDCSYDVLLEELKTPIPP